MPVDIFGPAIQAIQQNRANRLRDFQLEQAQKQVGREEEKRLALSEAPDFQTRIEALRRLGDVEAEQEMLNSEFARIGTLAKLDSKAAAQQYNRTIGRVSGNRISPDKEVGDFSVFKLKNADGAEKAYAFDKQSGTARTLDVQTPEGQSLDESLKRKKQKFDQEKDLRNEVTKKAKDFNLIGDSFAKIQAVAQGAPTAAGDLSLIFNYMKILDPGSAVKEQEQATAANARGVPEAVRSLWNRLLSGEKLGANQRQDFLNQSQNIYQSQQDRFNLIREDYKNLAIKNGLDPNNVILKSQRESKKRKYNPATQRIE